MRINKITQRRVVAIEANSISASPADVLLGSDKNTTNSINLKLALKRFLFPNENKMLVCLIGAATKHIVRGSSSFGLFLYKTALA